MLCWAFAFPNAFQTLPHLILRTLVLGKQELFPCLTIGKAESQSWEDVWSWSMEKGGRARPGTYQAPTFWARSRSLGPRGTCCRASWLIHRPMEEVFLDSTRTMRRFTKPKFNESRKFWPINSVSEIENSEVPKRIEKQGLRGLYASVHSSVIDRSQKVETAPSVYQPMNGWIKCGPSLHWNIAEL